MTESDKKSLREMVPLSSVPDRQFEQMCEQCRVESGAPGTVLFQQGELNNSFFFLLQGIVSYAIGDVTIETVAAGSPAARFALAHQVPRKVTATAMTSIRFIRVDNELLRVDGRESHDGRDVTRQRSESPSIADLLLARRAAEQSRAQGKGTKLSALKRMFRWAKRGPVEPEIIRISRFESTNPAVSPAEDGAHRSQPQVIEVNREAINLPNRPVPFESDGIISDKCWNHHLPREIENQLQALLNPLMRDVSDISGGLVTTTRGTFLSSNFPKHRIGRVQAIFQAAIAADNDESFGDCDDTPEEILVRERNSMLLIFLIENQGLLALNANSSANLGLIRLEVRPVLIQVRDIISRETERAMGA